MSVSDIASANKNARRVTSQAINIPATPSEAKPKVNRTPATPKHVLPLLEVFFTFFSDSIYFFPVFIS